MIPFVQEIFRAGKPVGAICHAPWTLVEADLIRGRMLTSFPSVRTDIRNAGDLDAFCAKIVEEFAEGKHPVHDVGATAPA